MSARLKEYTAEELKPFNGEDGRPIYVAHGGKVYDLTESRRWKKGLHMNRHSAGYDLTQDIAAAPHTAQLLEKFPVVGVFKKAAAEGPKIPLFLKVALEAFPFLKRHPHPMTVHFPLVCHIFTSLFTFLYLTSGVQAFETTAFVLLGAGVLFTIVAGVTGLMTWWLNYMAAPMTPVRIKMALTVLMFLCSLICFIWRALEPDLLVELAGADFIYVGLAFSLFPMVSLVGYLGAELTFPTHGGRE